MNENYNTPDNENEDDLMIGDEPTNDGISDSDGDGSPSFPGAGFFGPDDDSSDDGSPETDDSDEQEVPTDKTDDDSETVEGDGESADETTGELVEVPADEESTPSTSLLTGILLGTTLMLAAAVAVLTVLLLRRRRTSCPSGKDAQAAAPLSIGKLHEIGDRESQQDCFAVSPAEMSETHGLLAVVADGMGGLADGDKVSQSAVATMLDGFFSVSGAPGDILLTLTERANRRINQLLGPGGIGKSGSTLVAGLLRDGKFHYVSIGDSRICLYRDGQLIQLNREHIYRNELAVQALSGIGTLQEAAQHPKAAGLTSYLGMGHLRYVDIPAGGITVRSGDKFILMSDGVYNALTEAELSGALNEDAAQAAEKIRAMIAQKAYRHQDNYTAVILAC